MFKDIFKIIVIIIIAIFAVKIGFSLLGLAFSIIWQVLNIIVLAFIIYVLYKVIQNILNK